MSAVLRWLRDLWRSLPLGDPERLPNVEPDPEYCPNVRLTNEQLARLWAGMEGEIADQPPPQRTAGVAIWDLVILDMQQRDRVGRERYGTPLQAGNGRDALVDAYQEGLDLVVYLRQAIAERDGS